MTYEVIDEASKDTTAAPVKYEISSYGADYDVEGLVRKIERGDIVIPDFQRSYVWPYRDASRFIESLLLGLPIPGVFFAKERGSNKFLVIDGQQRLRTLQFFYDGFFNPNREDKTRKVFQLSKSTVAEEFDGLTYDTLSEEDRRKLDNSIIHATIVKQEHPRDGDTSIYHIFERLNNAGTRLTPQEIRVAIYHGSFIDRIKHLNEDENWRRVFGKFNKRLKDQELIVRFLTLFLESQEYSSPMKEFLNIFCEEHQYAGDKFLNSCESAFRTTIKVVFQALGERAFRPERALNAAVFDSTMCGIAWRLARSSHIDLSRLQSAYAGLIQDPAYLELVSKATSNEKNVADRLGMARASFENV